jgi:orotidine-5'-phosphate decarboxylase
MPMPASDKLILALDFPDFESAKKLVDELGDEVIFYKIGLELLMSGDYFKLLSYLKSKDKKVFCDLKLYDISQTVANAVKNLANYDVDLLTIHSASYDIMARAAEHKGKMQLIAVTVLTNLDSNDLLDMGFDPQISLEELVIKKTKLSLRAGLDGIVSSGLEARILRQNFEDEFLIVSPGIRLEKMIGDDQKRTCDVKEALINGSSHLVVGRPITRAADSKIAAQKFNQAIHEGLTNFSAD